MNEEILINVTPQETRVALVQQGAVQELHVERTLSRGRVGNVYLGKVVRVLPGMQSAFIDIGLERAAFLHVADIWHPRIAGEAPHQAPHQPIEKIVFEGQTLMVQVVKDPIGTKGARLSTQVSIAGRTLVYLPQEPHIGISQKIESEATALVHSAKSDFPSQTEALKSSIDKLTAAVKALPPSPSARDVASLAGEVAGVVSSASSFADASKDKCS